MTFNKHDKIYRHGDVITFSSIKNGKQDALSEYTCLIILIFFFCQMNALRQILHLDLNFHPFKIAAVQKLNPVASNVLSKITVPH